MNTANTAFVLIASVLVWFMTPGLAFFYGGMVSKRNVINTMFSVFYITGVAILLWAACGYELSFGPDQFGIIGRLHGLFLNGAHLTRLRPDGLPNGVFALFQMMFAIITPALFIGAVVGRIRWGFLTWFIILWSFLIYYPLVHLVWSPHGLMAGMGVLDFAGGTVIHINAGITALVLSLFLGRRRQGQDEPYSRAWILLGTAILWIGWYGFNAGSALAANMAAVTAALTTSIAAASAMCTWMLLDIHRGGKPTLIGVCTGALCGLVGITPAAGYVTAFGSFAIGVCSTLASFGFVNYLKPRLHIDDTLDAFGCHGVSGIIGSVLTGAFASKSVAPSLSANGLFYGGGWHLLLVQLLGTGITIALVAIMATVIVLVLRKITPMRVSAAEEALGLDLAEHGESEGERPATSDVLRYPDEFIGQLGGFAPQKQKPK
ncbi:ammonium transporter [Lacticaseibacillus zhaodongensis]|uniref:ammonium transporter n=1 Tax=Lacticaseibacillus zhaodongensis TaxID=2668065 RepID=UPI0012D332B7|nr:ammonium transporter [Lacticaseibacillus zhaodongensis]